ncbi:MAG: hypothetical protein OEW04_07040 [Nitrospirota bacterium]|nr:hypothetical protein [Nitrospirota bacterium]
MHIVAIHSLQDKKEALAGALSAALKCTAYEALSRLRVPGSGPVIVGVSAAIGPAEELMAKLGASGFAAILLKAGEIESGSARFVVRKFRFGEDGLIAGTGAGESLAVDYGGIDLFIRGTSIAQVTGKETIKEKKFDPGMALLTSGMKMTKTTGKILESSTQTREGFLIVYAGEHPALLFREGGLSYDSLGAALQPTRQANFSHLIGELRRRCPEAPYDDRLLTRAGQIQVLGPLLSPEDHLDIAISLLAKLLRPSGISFSRPQRPPAQRK